MDYHRRIPHEQQLYNHYLYTTSYPTSYMPSYLDNTRLPVLQLQQGIYEHQPCAYQQQQTEQPLSTYPAQEHYVSKAAATTSFGAKNKEAQAQAPEGGGMEAIATVRREASMVSGVNELMQAIQSKPLNQSTLRSSSSDSGEATGTFTDGGRSGTIGGSTRVGNPNKRHECNIGECRKSFLQASHLKIHIRAHTGAKPYACTYATCKSAFSQLGNFKTHLRRHAGERPFACRICSKSFIDRGSLRTHSAVHSTRDAAQKYACRLDGCKKRYTQLGNLKTHINKHHQETLRGLIERLPEEKCENGGEEGELLQYFRGLYPNANKGIKGRGKGRKVFSFPLSPAASLSSSTLPSSSCSARGMNTNLNLGLGMGTGMDTSGVGYWDGDGDKCSDRAWE